MAIGKLAVPSDVQAHVLGSGLRVLGLSPEHGLATVTRSTGCFIVQARREGFTLLTGDDRIRAYDVAMIDPLT